MSRWHNYTLTQASLAFTLKRKEKRKKKKNKQEKKKIGSEVFPALMKRCHIFSKILCSTLYLVTKSELKLVSARHCMVEPMNPAGLPSLSKQRG